MDRELAEVLAVYLAGDDGSVERLERYVEESRGTKLSDIKHEKLDERFYLVLSLMSREVNRTLACDFAAHVLPVFEAQCPGQEGARRKIETFRRWTVGEVDEREMREAVSWNCFTPGYSPAWNVLNAIGQAINGVDWEDVSNPWIYGRRQGAAASAANAARRAIRELHGDAAEVDELRWQIASVLMVLEAG